MTAQKHLFLVQMEPLTLSSQLIVYFKVIHLHHTSSLYSLDFIFSDPINNHGLTLQERKSTHQPSKHITDLDYEGDIALPSDQINKAEMLLQSLETTAHKVGLTLNSTKTECMLLNKESTGNEIHTLNGTFLNTADDFKYLGSYIKDSKNYFNIREELA